MKFTKMSLVAALLVGSSAFAIENVKVSGDAKLYYSTTQDANDAFSKEASAGQAAVSLSLGADLGAGVSTGVKATALSTLGLEGQLVNNVWEGTNGTSDSYIVNEAWLATTVGKTTAKIGRMELDTPLVFSEKWSIVANSFEAAVVINQDIPDTVLVGAYVGGSNKQWNQAGTGFAGVIAARNTTTDTTFSQFYNGAYAVAAINNSYKPLTAQAWYFDASHIGTAWWLQADLAMDGILAGLQVTSTDLTAAHPTFEANTAFALMVGYEMKDTVTAKLSYSSVDKTKNGVGAGFNLAGTGQSKLYTEAWWNYGKVTANDMSAINLTVEAPNVMEMADLGLYITQTMAGTGTNDMTEVTATASKSFGPLDATAAVIYTSVDTGTTDDSGTIQAYLTYNF